MNEIQSGKEIVTVEEKNLTTVGREASAEFTEKKSVFIGYTAPVKNVDEAEEFIRKIKKKQGEII